MDQATSSVRETAAFARRVVVRTLTVVGGAAAGTAIAWCLSTTGASADTAPTAPEIPVVTTVVAPVSDAVHSVVDNLRDTPPPKNPLGEFGEKVNEAADRFGERASDRVEQLPQCADKLCGVHGDIEGIGGDVRAPGDDSGLGRSDSPASSPAAAGSGSVATAGVDPDRTAEHTATGRAHSDGMSRRGSPDPGAPSSPDLPTWPTPFAPALPALPTVPTSSHNGSTGNPADPSLFAALPWQDRATALVRGLTVPATVATTFGRVGAQPGVSPD
ncbi:MAG: hypothetical protein GEV28_11595 [Actinophytocola sp.]|uniref:hypothetical protein n=1 Tax=Actinophytocola sp. TaxID=1872138 RepID=UPI0013245168|nr:hypothetical protein [Actinophytocola sp.]MPZ80999.1 hypothetical protein [Actinophytocola sp.]